MERIHRANLINFGIIPAILSNPQDYDALNHNDELVIDNLRDQLSGGSELIMTNKTKGNSISLKVELTDRERAMILAGGLINSTKMQR
jgi:aconitate hydratase